ncbi:Uma2 family endonuclease [Streptomyces varsoviensis]|uniref:Uma2 family endonuclease n=1 Tax=Streptomyces varsoviensis TaxID=67373 RepID=UPI0033F18712
MTAPVHEPHTTADELPDPDEFLWQTWKAMDPPEGLRAEIIGGSIEVWPHGRVDHGVISSQLYQELTLYLVEQSSPYVVNACMYVVHDRKVWIPDAFVAPADVDGFVSEDDIGIEARCVALVAEVVALGHDGAQRDRDRKRQAYARAGIPVYVLIDPHDAHGTVTILSSPSPAEAVYAAETRVPYGTEVTIPEGPAKGLVIGEEITGPPRKR